MEFQRPSMLNMRTDPRVNERWLQERISEDPSLLGLGDVIVKDLERRQPRAGRLDILLSDLEGDTRYEVEVQLGATDESHIIRTIEYWDIERRRYPQYDHVAVIVAEDITSRFLNVISLFNGFIPLIAIQVRAMEVGEVVTVVATRVLDVMTIAPDEDEDESGAVTDRHYWETQRSNSRFMALADKFFELIRANSDPSLSLSYKQRYMGLVKDGLPNNFVSLSPKKQFLRVSFRIPRSEEWTKRLEEGGLDTLEYDARWGQYRLRLTEEDFERAQPILADLVRDAYRNAGR